MCVFGLFYKITRQNAIYTNVGVTARMCVFGLFNTGVRGIYSVDADNFPDACVITIYSVCPNLPDSVAEYRCA